jgi:hypothetical protein
VVPLQPPAVPAFLIRTHPVAHTKETNAMSFPLLTVGPTSETVDDDARLLLGRPYNIRPLDTPASDRLEEQFFVEWEVAEAS